MSLRFTASCSPVFMSRTVTSPRASSSPPTMTVRAPQAGRRASSAPSRLARRIPSARQVRRAAARAAAQSTRRAPSSPMAATKMPPSRASAGSGSASTSRSSPAAKPIPARSGPPSFFTRPSYRPPPSSAFCAPSVCAQNLEGRPRVVVEAAHEAVRNPPRDPGSRQVALHGSEVRRARLAEIVHRRAAGDR